VAGGVGQKHCYLGVLDPTGGPGVLPLHTHRVAARLQIAGVVDDQHGVGVAQFVDHVTAHVVAYRVGVPDRLTQQALHPVRTAVAGLLRQLPTRASVHIRQQAEQERPRLPAWLHPAEPAGDVREPDLELLHPVLDRYSVAGGRHTIFCCLHKSLMITWRPSLQR
jgi:hypothetical protein